MIEKIKSNSVRKSHRLMLWKIGNNTTLCMMNPWMNVIVL